MSGSVPVRRSRWPSFWIGAAAVAGSSLIAAASAGSLLLLPVNVDGTVVIIAFGILWFGIFFLSYPLQRRYARSLDLRRPGIGFVKGVLVVHVTNSSTLHFNLSEPHELKFGWWEYVTVSTGPTGRSRAVWTHATLSQAGRQMFLIAEDSVREAQAAAWPKTPDSSTPVMPRVSLWASDLVALVDAIRARSVSSMPEQHPPAPATQRVVREIVKE